MPDQFDLVCERLRAINEDAIDHLVAERQSDREQAAILLTFYGVLWMLENRKFRDRKVFDTMLEQQAAELFALLTGLQR
jgi:hypothetical protein